MKNAKEVYVRYWRRCTALDRALDVFSLVVAAAAGMKQPEFECPCGGMFVIVRSYEKFNILECKICRGLARYDGEKLEAQKGETP